MASELKHRNKIPLHKDTFSDGWIERQGNRLGETNILVTLYFVGGHGGFYLRVIHTTVGQTHHFPDTCTGTRKFH